MKYSPNKRRGKPRTAPEITVRTTTPALKYIADKRRNLIANFTFQLPDIEYLSRK